MSAIKIKTQNVTPCTKDIRKHNSSDLSSEDIQKIAGIFKILQEKASMLKKIHNSLGVGGIKNIFDMENPTLTIEEQQILKGKYLVLNKKIALYSFMWLNNQSRIHQFSVRLYTGKSKSFKEFKATFSAILKHPGSSRFGKEDPG